MYCWENRIGKQVTEIQKNDPEYQPSFTELDVNKLTRVQPIQFHDLSIIDRKLQQDADYVMVQKQDVDEEEKKEIVHNNVSYKPNFDGMSDEDEDDDNDANYGWKVGAPYNANIGYDNGGSKIVQSASQDNIDIAAIASVAAPKSPPLPFNPTDIEQNNDQKGGKPLITDEMRQNAPRQISVIVVFQDTKKRIVMKNNKKKGIYEYTLAILKEKVFKKFEPKGLKGRFELVTTTSIRIQTDEDIVKHLKDFDGELQIIKGASSSVVLQAHQIQDILGAAAAVENESEQQEAKYSDDAELESLPLRIFGESGSKFMCEVCHNVPLKSASCQMGHIFCSKCIKKLADGYSVCPVGRQHIIPNYNMSIIDHLIQKEKCICLYGGEMGATKGNDAMCDWEGTVKDLLDHLETCLFRPKERKMELVMDKGGVAAGPGIIGMDDDEEVVNDLEEWLQGLGFEQYLTNFNENEFFNLEDVKDAELEKSDLSDMGIKPMMHKKKILKAIQLLGMGAEAPNSPKNAIPFQPNVANYALSAPPANHQQNEEQEGSNTMMY